VINKFCVEVLLPAFAIDIDNIVRANTDKNNNFSFTSSLPGQVLAWQVSVGRSFELYGSNDHYYFYG
jgi:hypothetical protein